MRQHPHRPLIVALFAIVPWLAPPAAAAAPPARGAETSITVKVGEPVNINTAGVKELMRLEGVSRRVAERIVQYREARGPFKQPEELRRVEGIGHGLWERNRARIVVK